MMYLFSFQFHAIMEVLNEIHEEDIQDLRRELQECPPQVSIIDPLTCDMFKNLLEYLQLYTIFNDAPLLFISLFTIIN